MLASSLLVGALTCCAAAATAPVPQGGIERAPAVALPGAPAAVQFGPYLGLQAPEPNDTRAAGAADFDGNGVEDLWFLAGSGLHGGEISVQMARTASVGRYRSWHVEPPTVGQQFADGATLRTVTTTQDIALFVDPALAGLRRLQFTWSTTGDPRTGPTALWSLGYILPFSVPDTGIYEIETRNDSGDTCDDIVLLIDTGTGTEVRKLCMTSGPGGYTIAATVSATVPIALDKLRLLDLDADGSTDFVADAPGLGVVACRDNGSGTFELATFVPTLQVQIVDLFTGELLAEHESPTAGDAFGICTVDAVMLGWLTHAGVQTRFLPAPAAATPLATATIVLESPDSATLVGVAQSGQSLWVQRYFRDLDWFGQAGVALAPDPSLFLGAGPLGLAAFAADIDGDRDDDLLMQHPDGTHWFTVRNTAGSLAPVAEEVEHLGPLGNESGFFWERHTVHIPDDWSIAPYGEVEVAVFLRHPITNDSGFWDRRILPVDYQNRTVTFDIFMQVIESRVADMHANPSYWRGLFAAFGMTAGGFTQISIHGKARSDPMFLESPKRHESLLVIHDPGGQGSKSAQGVKWETAEEPPLPTADDEILPWN